MGKGRSIFTSVCPGVSWAFLALCQRAGLGETVSDRRGEGPRDSHKTRSNDSLMRRKEDCAFVLSRDSEMVIPRKGTLTNKSNLILKIRLHYSFSLEKKGRTYRRFKTLYMIISEIPEKQGNVHQGKTLLWKYATLEPGLPRGSMMPEVDCYKFLSWQLPWKDKAQVASERQRDTPGSRPRAKKSQKE